MDINDHKYANPDLTTAILIPASYSLQSVSLPLRQDSRFSPLLKRFDTCRPVGMVRSKEDEFLLCYDGTFI